MKITYQQEATGYKEHEFKAVLDAVIPLITTAKLSKVANGLKAIRNVWKAELVIVERIDFISMHRREDFKDLTSELSNDPTWAIITKD